MCKVTVSHVVSWACIFLILWLFRRGPIFLFALISSYYLSTSATLLPYSPSTNLYPHLNQPTNQQTNEWLSRTWPEEPFEVGVSFSCGKGGVRLRAVSPLPGQLGKQSKLLQLRASGQSAGAAQRLWSWKLHSKELTRERRYWRPTKPAASAQGVLEEHTELQGRSRKHSSQRNQTRGHS